MITSRRGFLGSLAAFAAACAANPDLAAFEPGKTLYSIPKMVKPIFPQITLDVGDIFTIEGRYSINPRTRRIAETINPVTGKKEKHLQRYTVKFTVEGRSALDPRVQAEVFPSTITDGQFQNVVIDPASDTGRIIVGWPNGKPPEVFLGLR